MKAIGKLVFTFQYVSINTYDSSCLDSDESNLHSNMFLLIPLLDYFGVPVNPEFTFQYVSINTTATREEFKLSVGNLHSNMFLLILYRLNGLYYPL